MEFNTVGCGSYNFNEEANEIICVYLLFVLVCMMIVLLYMMYSPIYSSQNHVWDIKWYIDGSHGQRFIINDNTN